MRSSLGKKGFGFVVVCVGGDTGEEGDDDGDDAAGGGGC